MKMPSADSWCPREIMLRAKREAERPTLTRGEKIAWTNRSYAGYTDHLSDVHSVYDEYMTYCELEIPHFIRHLPPLRSLDKCSTCSERVASGWELPVKKSATNDSDLEVRVA